MLSLPRLRVRRAGRVSKGDPLPPGDQIMDLVPFPRRVRSHLLDNRQVRLWRVGDCPRRAMAHVRRSHEFYGKVEVPLFEYLVYPSFESRHVPFFNRRHCVPPWQHRACPE